MKLRPHLLALVVCLSAAWSGCAKVHTAGKSPLAPLALQPGSVTLEKYSVRFPYADVDLNDTIWTEIDEQSLSLELRNRLSANGIRAGLIGAHLPAALEAVLRENPVESASQSSLAGDDSFGDESPGFEPKPVDLLHETRVRRGVLQTRSGQSGMILTAGEHTRIPHLAVLVRSADGQVTGRNYEKVLGLLAVTPFAEPDGRVRVELLPEIEYGEPQQRYVPADGMFRMEFRPATTVFTDLRIDATLTPGQMLVLASRADKPGTLGHHLFTEQSSGKPLEQKLILVRLTQAPGDISFRNSDLPPAAP